MLKKPLFHRAAMPGTHSVASCCCTRWPVRHSVGRGAKVRSLVWKSCAPLLWTSSDLFDSATTTLVALVAETTIDASTPVPSNPSPSPSPVGRRLSLSIYWRLRFSFHAWSDASLPAAAAALLALPVAL